MAQLQINGQSSKLSKIKSQQQKKKKKKLDYRTHMIGASLSSGPICHLDYNVSKKLIKYFVTYNNIPFAI
jgi:hypothetical protein